MHYKAPDNSLHHLSQQDIKNGGEKYLPNGSVQISDEEANAIRSASAKPAKIKSVTMRQARKALLRAGKLALVEQAIAGMAGQAGEEARIEWEYSNDVLRDQPLTVALSQALGFTEQEMDALFTTAATL